MKRKPIAITGDRPFVLHTRIVTGTGGGPEKTILNSPRYLRRFGIESACLFMHPPDDPGFELLRKKAAAADAPIVGIDDRGPLDLSIVRESIRVCRERNVTVWHAHDYKSNALGLLVRRFHPMHLVTTAHGWVRFTARTPIYYRIDEFCMKRYEQVICVSQDLHRRCRKLAIDGGRLHLIENAIVLEDYATAAPMLTDRIRFGFDSRPTMIGAIGRLSEEKGFHHLIEAVSRLIRSGDPIGLVIAGEGHLRESLQAQIDELGLRSHIRLVGFLSDPRELYRAIDLFVLSSLREGLPNVVLEAMASGRAVVATDCNGIPQLLTSEQNGLVVPADDCDSLTTAIRRCVDSNTLRARLADAGRATVEDRFCFDRRMAKVVDVYRRLSPALAAAIRPEPVCRDEQSERDQRPITALASI